MIYTINFANIKHLPENIIPISISLYPPKGIHINQEKKLAPTNEILMSYKKNPNEKKYIKDYKSYLESINVKEIILNLINKHENIALCCFESIDDFCHRHILAEEIEKILEYTKNSINEFNIIGKRRNGYFYPNNKERIAIVGSRDCFNYALVQKTVLNYIGDRTDIIIVSGGAKGADSLGAQLADENNFQKDIYEANWDKFGKSAGFKRNIEIVENSDIVFAFTNGSKGTAHTISLAQKAKKQVIITPFGKCKNVSYLKKYTNKIVKNNPDKIFVFGDNLLNKGKCGQAIIRDNPNAFGIPTKRKPSMSKDSFFSDKEDEFEIVKNKLRELYKEKRQIIFPLDGLGTGLADMKMKSPKLFSLMNDIIDFHFIGKIK